MELRLLHLSAMTRVVLNPKHAFNKNMNKPRNVGRSQSRGQQNITRTVQAELNPVIGVKSVTGNPPPIRRGGEMWVKRTFTTAALKGNGSAVNFTLGDFAGASTYAILHKLKVWSLSTRELTVLLNTGNVTTLGDDGTTATDYAPLSQFPGIEFCIPKACAKQIYLLTENLASIGTASTTDLYVAHATILCRI